MGRQNRPRIEDILEVRCPVCLVPPTAFCRRAVREFRASTDKALAAAGTPPSHIERLWLRQGHGPADFPALRAGLGSVPPRRKLRVSLSPGRGARPAAREFWPGLSLPRDAAERELARRCAPASWAAFMDQLALSARAEVIRTAPAQARWREQGWGRTTRYGTEVDDDAGQRHVRAVPGVRAGGRAAVRR